MLILTPDNDPFFYPTLAAPPPQPGQTRDQIVPTALVFEPGQTVGRPATAEELREYIWGGEYDEREEELGNDQVSERF